MWREQRGSFSVAVAIMLTTLLGMAALALDVGRLYVERHRLAAVADASALSAAHRLPGNPDGAAVLAREYLTTNSVDPNDATVTVGPDRHHITVELNRTMTMSFGQLIGIEEKQVAASATAWVGSLSGAQAVVPLGISDGSFQVGDVVTLKLSPHDGFVAPGNYQALALGSAGASDYELNLMNGYPGWIRVDDWLETKPGNMAGPTVRAVNHRINHDPDATFETVRKGSARLVTVPILEDYNLNGRGEVHVIGFALFFLEGAVDTGVDKGEVTGRFLRMPAEGEISASAPDYGAYGIKLSQ